MYLLNKAKTGPHSENRLLAQNLEFFGQKPEFAAAACNERSVDLAGLTMKDGTYQTGVRDLRFMKFELESTKVTGHHGRFSCLETGPDLVRLHIGTDSNTIG